MTDESKQAIIDAWKARSTTTAEMRDPLEQVLRGLLETPSGRVKLGASMLNPWRMRLDTRAMQLRKGEATKGMVAGAREDADLLALFLGSLAEDERRASDVFGQLRTILGDVRGQHDMVRDTIKVR